jgi:hypothetical protein
MALLPVEFASCRIPATALSFDSAPPAPLVAELLTFVF